jgi:hypothetical protein
VSKAEPVLGDAVLEEAATPLTMHFDSGSKRFKILRCEQPHNIVTEGIRKMFTLVSLASLAIAFICAIVIAVDEIPHPQKMWIMNVVWPVTALYFSIFALWGNFRMGRGMAKSAMAGMFMDVQTRGTGQKEQEEWARRDPTWRQTAISDTHRGAGCVIGDVIAEFGLFALGWTLFGSSLYAEYAGDLLLAWLFGIAFQYFALKPMVNLSVKQGIIAAIKSDTLSILTFEVGLFGWSGLDLLCFLSPSASSSDTSGLLVHDANWDDSWIPHLLPNESLSH